MSPLRARLLRALPVAFALLGAVLVLNLIAFGFGQAPLATLRQAFAGTWGTPYGVGQVLFKATPLILTGLAFHVALRAGLFNIGAEGQLALGSLAGGWVASKLPASTPWPVGLMIALAAAVLIGALYGGIAGALRARLGVHEIISGIMLNRIAEVLLPWLLVAVLASVTLRTADGVPGAALPRLDRFFSWLSGSAASLAFPLAVGLTYAVAAWLRRSRAGREMRWVGQNPEASAAEGIDVRGRRILAMALSGGLAAFAASATVFGYKGYFELGLGAGAGFTGIAVAMLGRGSPTGIVLAAILFGTLEQAGFAINAKVPKDAMAVLEAVVIVLVAIAYRAAPSAGVRPAEPAPETSSATGAGRA